MVWEERRKMAGGSSAGGGDTFSKWMEGGFGAASATPRTSLWEAFFLPQEEEEFACLQCATKRDTGGRDAAMYRRGSAEPDSMMQRMERGKSSKKTPEPPWSDLFGPSSMGRFVASGGREFPRDSASSGAYQSPHAPAQRGSPPSSSLHHNIEVQENPDGSSQPHTGLRRAKSVSKISMLVDQPHLDRFPS